MTDEVELLPAVGSTGAVRLNDSEFTAVAGDNDYPTRVWIVDPDDEKVWACFDRELIEDLPYQRQRAVLEAFVTASWSGFENGYDAGQQRLKQDFRRLLGV